MLLRLDDFDGIIPDPKSTRFDYLLTVSDFALKKLRQEEEEEEGRRDLHLCRGFSHFLPPPAKGRRKMGYFCSIENEKKIVMAEMGKRNKRRKTQEKVSVGMECRPPLPERFARYINGVGGREVKMVVQKRLSRSDVDQSQARLSIPRLGVKEEFLTAEETAALGMRWGTNGSRVGGVDARLIVEPGEMEWAMNLKQWGQIVGRGNYVLTSQWNSVVEAGRFREDDEIQLWSFRVGDNGGGELNLVLVRLGF